MAHIFFIAKVETCEGEPLVEYGVTELPECIVCLERMDESVTGMNLTSTILCNHTFHGKCLKQWNNQKCPICRYIQSPNPDGYNDEETTEVQSSSKMGVNNRNSCAQCQLESDRDLPNSTLGLNPKVQELWICLVCGIVGCGRYDKQHASDHFMSTGHNYTMSLSNNRVWDYQNDVFVHRLFQTSGVSENEANEGKLVEKVSKDSVCCSFEKPIEKQILQLEMQCMQVLSQQLDTQRQYWEARLQEEKQEWQAKQLSLSSNRTTNQTQTDSGGEKNYTDTNCTAAIETELKKELIKVKTVYGKCAKQLQDEKAVSKALTENLTITQKERDGMKEQMRNLEELNRDLTFHFQAQNNEAIQEATVLNVSPNKEKSKNSSSRRKKR